MGHVITDDELVAASRRGERAAYGRLIERHLDAVWAVSFSSTRNQALSDDVVQDTFVAAWSRLDRLREASRLRAWLCGIARNLSRKARRRAGRELPAEAAAEPVSDATPFEAVSRAETDKVVAAALAELPAGYREVLVLYYQHEHAIDEVAATLGISVDAATQRLSRGRRLLATHMVDLVEGSLRVRRSKPAVVAAVLAILPPLPSSSAIVTSLHPTRPRAGATSMLKLAAIVLATAGVAGTTYVATRADRSAPAQSASLTASPAAVERSPSAPIAAPAARAVARGPQVAAAPAPSPAAGPACDPSAGGPGTCERAGNDGDGTEIDPALLERIGVYRGPGRGPVDAPVQIAVYQDLECQFCELLMATLDELWTAYPGQLRLVVKDFPLPHHGNAQVAAEAGRAADAQGKLWEFREAALASRDDLTRDALVELARGIGLDVATFTRDLDGHRYRDVIAADFAGGQEVGVDGTPTLIINGRRYSGAQPTAAFRAAIDRALAERRGR